jgi:hypothetical protein
MNVQRGLRRVAIVLGAATGILVFINAANEQRDASFGRLGELFAFCLIVGLLAWAALRLVIWAATWVVRGFEGNQPT